MTISGSSFGSSGASVMIGSASCEVTSQSDSSIVCVLPANVPGDYEVDVEIDGIGLADTRLLVVYYTLYEIYILVLVC